MEVVVVILILGCKLALYRFCAGIERLDFGMVAVGLIKGNAVVHTEVSCAFGYCQLIA